MNGGGRAFLLGGLRTINNNGQDDGSQNILEGEFISKEGRTEQVSYFKDSHFRIGFESTYKPTTTTGE